jgi:hypothetical protein
LREGFGAIGTALDIVAGADPSLAWRIIGLFAIWTGEGIECRFDFVRKIDYDRPPPAKPFAKCGVVALPPFSLVFFIASKRSG